MVGAEREDYGCRGKTELAKGGWFRKDCCREGTFWKTAGASSKSRVAKKWLLRWSGSALDHALTMASQAGANCLGRERE